MNSTHGNNSRDTHVLPKGLVKVRHYGLSANRHRAQRLAQSRRLLLPALGAAAALANAGPAGRSSAEGRTGAGAPLSPMRRLPLRAHRVAHGGGARDADAGHVVAARSARER
jgi:hypothetical protein